MEVRRVRAHDEKTLGSSGLSKRPEPRAARTHARAEPPCSRNSAPWLARPLEPAPAPSAPPASPHVEKRPDPVSSFRRDETMVYKGGPEAAEVRVASPRPTAIASRRVSSASRETGHARAHPARASASPRFHRSPVRVTSPRSRRAAPILRLTRKRLFAFPESLSTSSSAARRRNPEAL